MPSETLTTLDMAAGDAVVIAVPFGEQLVSSQEEVAVVMGEAAPVGRPKLGSGHVGLAAGPEAMHFCTSSHRLCSALSLEQLSTYPTI